MATITSLNKSITNMDSSELYQHLSAIRARRRTRPQPKQKSTPAKIARKADKKNLKQQDLFQYAQGLSSEAKAKLAATLLKEMIK